MNEHDDTQRSNPSDAPSAPSPTDEAGIDATPMAAWAPPTTSDARDLSAHRSAEDHGHFDDTADAARDHPTAVLDDADLAAHPRRGRRILTLGLAATVLLTVGAGGGAFAAIQLQNAQQTTTAQVGGTANGGTGGSTQGGTGQGFGFGGQSGSGQSGSGQSGSGQSGTGQSGSGQNRFGQNGFGQGGTSTGTGAGTAATAAQTVGVVTIVTTLGYESGEAAGTGIILNSSGRILTNNHVIDGATAISVTDESTGKSYTAKVVGTDSTDDVAVLQLQGASGLTAATLASDAATAGESVTAVGNAGGTGTLSAAAGSVTALDQSITTAAEGSSASEKLTGLIETDADVVSGDSGGPLIASDGSVLGIDTAASSGSADVTGYAIPIDHAMSIADDIVAGKDTADITLGYPAFLGVSVSSQASTTTGSGAVVQQVITGTPAASTGLAAGDTITKVDGTSIASATALTTTLRDHAPGDSVKITYTDADGASHSVQVTLTTGPAD